MPESYHRHLPHQVPEGFPIFLTWNLKGAVPQEVAECIRQKREQLAQETRKKDETEKDRKLRHDKLIFAYADRYLDSTTEGPMQLKDPRAAKIVEDAILFGCPDRYDLFAWCVMGNHVHVLLQPKWELAKITQGMKGFAAHEINGLLDQRGQPFWQDESYDHWARDEEEMLRIIHYIENNPVAAGLVSKPADWLWSSSRFRPNWIAGTPLPRPSSS